MSSLAKCSLHTGLKKAPFSSWMQFGQQNSSAVSYNYCGSSVSMTNTSSQYQNSLFNVHTHTHKWYGKMAIGVRPATNVVTDAPQSVRTRTLWALCKGTTSWRLFGIFRGAGLGTRRNSSNSTTGVVLAPDFPGQGTVDGTDVFALFCHPSRSQVPNLQVGMLEQWR